MGENAIVNPEQGYSDAVYSYTGTAYIHGFEYIISKTKTQGYGGVWIYSDVFNPGKIYTPEGYIDNLSASISPIVSNGVRYNYYRKDHLGNIREVWNGVRKNYYNQVKEAASTRQRTQYYPSGLPWAESFGAAVQKNKFNGCEFIEMHGFDVTDLGNRGVQNATNRFTSMDRFCEKFPWQSPYVHAGNNPVNYVDVNGDSVGLNNLYDVDENGNYLYKRQIISFELFAVTPEGTKFILDRAEKGFKLQGVFVKDLDINAKSDGKLSKTIDANFEVKDLSNIEVGGGAAGYTDYKISNNRLELYYQMDAGSPNELRNWAILDAVNTCAHEPLIHGYFKEKDFLSNSPIKGNINDIEHRRSVVVNTPYYKQIPFIMERTRIRTNSQYSWEYVWKTFIFHGK